MFVPSRPEKRPTHLLGRAREFSPLDLTWIATQFELEDICSLVAFRERGNINLHTFEVECKDGGHYLLQRLNTDIFSEPVRVMQAMEGWIASQREYISSGRAPEWTVWEPVTLVPTRSGSTYLDLSDDSGHSFWRMMHKIPGTVTFKSLSEVADPSERERLAEEVGRGLALSADFTSPMATDSLVPSLPGYRDTRGYFLQFRSVLAGNRSREEALHWLPDAPEVRAATQALYCVHLEPDAFDQRVHDEGLQPFIDLCRKQEANALRIFEAVETGKIRKTAIHGDTKIDNFLFCRHTGKVRSLVDLDTIMPFTWLADWGDMMRSLCNVAGERETDTGKIQVSREIYTAVTRGFLGTTREITPAEIELMPDAVQIIALELGLRFLTDYLRGDNYFLLGPEDPPDLNRTRAIAQLTLFKRLVEEDAWTRELVQSMAQKYGLV